MSLDKLKAEVVRLIEHMKPLTERDLEARLRLLTPDQRRSYDVYLAHVAEWHKMASDAGLQGGDLYAATLDPESMWSQIMPRMNAGVEAILYGPEPELHCKSCIALMDDGKDPVPMCEACCEVAREAYQIFAGTGIVTSKRGRR